MVDHVCKIKRSEIMSRVKSKDTTPEMQVRRALHRSGHRFRLHRADLPGRPDLVFPRYKMALFVHGCFWHGHGCKRSKLPKSNVDYWKRKIATNVSRDEFVCRELERLGWKWRIIWQCEIDTGIRHISRELSENSSSQNSDFSRIAPSRNKKCYSQGDSKEAFE